MPIIEMKWSDEAYEDIKVFADKYGLSIQGSIKNALGLYKLAKEEIRKGNRIVIEDSKENHRKQIIIE